MVATFYWLPAGLTLPELVRRAGPPDQREYGWRRHDTLTYWLADGSSVLVLAYGDEVTAINHVTGLKGSKLYPLPDLVRLQPEPNHALQRTEAGGTSLLQAASFRASLCR